MPSFCICLRVASKSRIAEPDSRMISFVCFVAFSERRSLAELLDAVLVSGIFVYTSGATKDVSDVRVGDEASLTRFGDRRSVAALATLLGKVASEIKNIFTAGQSPNHSSDTVYPIRR